MMAGLSEIEWTNATWNPITGCTMISPGCTNCYAMRMAARLEAMSHSNYEGTTRKSGQKYVWTGEVKLIESALEAPLSWRKPKKVFVNSMSDLFQEAVPEAFILQIWSIMRKSPQHIFQILTKRPDRMVNVLKSIRAPTLKNVWLGTSVESAAYIHRLGHLRKTPAAVRFVSFEPLIGRIGAISLANIHWAIVGGESGPGARPLHPEWVDEIQQQCEEQSVAFFFKQWGGKNKKASGRIYKGKIWDAFPASSGY
jgi:protein gp37